MIDLMLPGREPETTDYEAQSALRTLLESEKLQDLGDEDLYARICEQIQYNQDMLSRVYDLVEGLKGKTNGTDADGLSRIGRALKSRKEHGYG